MSLPVITPLWDPPHQQHSLDVVDILGQGSSSVVFTVQDPQDPGRVPLAAKWRRHPASSFQDATVLKNLNMGGPRAGIPQLIDECQRGTILMEPIGRVGVDRCGWTVWSCVSYLLAISPGVWASVDETMNLHCLSGSPVQTLSPDHLDRCRPLNLGSQLCRILRSVHQAGWMNRDIRLCNMILAPPRRPNAAASSSTAAASGTDPSSATGPQWIRPPWPRVESSGGASAAASTSESLSIEDLDVYLIDWGTAIRVTDGPTLYEGGLRYASRRCLG